jgi:hypothetical protein
VLGIGGFSVGILTSLGGLAYVQFSQLPKESSTYIMVGFLSFIIGLVEFSVLSDVIDSGVTSTFVCFAEDPNALSETNPQLYQKVQMSYPQVLFV